MTCHDIARIRRGGWIEGWYPTKMCGKYALYVHQKSAIWAINIVLFWCFGADVARLEGTVPALVLKLSC